MTAMEGAKGRQQKVIVGNGVRSYTALQAITATLTFAGNELGSHQRIFNKELTSSDFEFNKNSLAVMMKIELRWGKDRSREIRKLLDLAKDGGSFKQGSRDRGCKMWSDSGYRAGRICWLVEYGMRLRVESRVIHGFWLEQLEGWSSLQLKQEKMEGTFLGRNITILVLRCLLISKWRFQEGNWI